MKNLLARFISLIIGLCILVSIFGIVILQVSFDTDLHIKIMTEHSQVSSLGFSDEQLKDSAKKITDYLNGDRDDMQIYTPNGYEIFNQRELTHMKDVKHLMNLAKKTILYLLTIAISLLVLLIIISKRASIGILCKSIIFELIILTILLLVVGAWYLFDFNSFWTVFHKLSFNNDLWLMYPTDAIIMLYTGEFFVAIVGRIIRNLVFCYGSTFAVCFILNILVPQKRGKTFGKCKNISNRN